MADFDKRRAVAEVAKMSKTEAEHGAANLGRILGYIHVLAVALQQLMTELDETKALMANQHELKEAPDGSEGDSHP